MAANKIKYGISGCYYAVATIASDGSATYDTPVALPGAVSLSLDQEGENSVFYADNIEYFIGANNHGYSGSLELALIPDSFRKDVLGDIEDVKGVLNEDANAPAIHFALIFQFEGDKEARKHVFYNCTATRPSVSGNTKNENIEPETETIDIEAKAVYNSGLNTMIVKAKSTKDTDATVYSGWESAVYQATAAATT